MLSRSTVYQVYESKSVIIFEFQILDKSIEIYIFNYNKKKFLLKYILIKLVRNGLNELKPKNILKSLINFYEIKTSKI